MTEYRIAVALAEDEHGSQPCTADFYNGPDLGPVAKLDLHTELFIVKADLLDDALELAYVAANADPDPDSWAERYRDAGRRSLSVGDVLFIYTPDDEPVRAVQVMPIGFDRVGTVEAADRVDNAGWAYALKVLAVPA